MKNFIYTLFILFYGATSIFAADQNNDSDREALLNTGNSRGIQTGEEQDIDDNANLSDCHCTCEQGFATAAGATALVSGAFSLSAVFDDLKIGIPGDSFSDNKVKDYSDLASKVLGFTSVCFSKSDEDTPNRQNRSHYRLSYNEKSMLKSSLILGFGAGLLSTAANFHGRNDTECGSYRNNCHIIAIAKNALNSAGLINPVIFAISERFQGKKNVRPYNHKTKVKALQRHLGWFTWVWSSTSNIGSWISDLQADSKGPAAIVRDATGIGAAFVELLSTSEIILNGIIQIDNRVGFGIYENPGQKLLANLPEDAQTKGWIESLCQACWATERVQIEYLKHPETNEVIGLEFMRENKPETKMSIIFGQIESSDKGYTFTFKPGLNSSFKMWSGINCNADTFKEILLPMGRWNAPAGAQVMNENAKHNLDLQYFLPKFDENSHRGTIIKIFDNQLMYKSKSERRNATIDLVIMSRQDYL